jgi:hypothetical protein
MNTAPLAPRIGRNVLVGCYSEQGQNPSDLNEQTLVLGGLHGAGFTPATLGGALTLDASGMSGLAVRSPIVHPTRSIIADSATASVNIDVTDDIIFADANQRDLQLVLPPNVNVIGRQYTIKRLDATTNHLFIRPLNPSNGETIDENLPGVDAYDLSGELSAVTLLAVSAFQWRVVNRMAAIKRGPPTAPTINPTL